ncbi:conjugal transfer protein [Vibrio cyclitrophicus 1F175]|uniref:TrbG/VirB9 family P-type conjugative transfer protein n=1 Tax=Vibrio TaxID=662 RepID=UPI0002E3B603|nr:TrbG/VirB9 family P-type conjugative transfer protein [Vibrio cyclitrophicus]OEF63576.1 conjugal transfer protein [Vibrio cyclitrophicus 1F175]
MLKKIGVILLGTMALPAFASNCVLMNYQEGDVVNVQTSSMLGTRIQLPANLVKPPVITNARLWDVGGDIGSSQIMLAPNSEDKAGAGTMVFAFTDDGKVYDILATRTTNKNHQPCVIVTKKRKFSFVPQVTLKKPEPKPVALSPSHKQVVKSTEKALDDYRTQIFTRYDWKSDSSFFGDDVVSDIYDDGRSTYIRLNKPNQKGLTVKAKINGEVKNIPTIAKSNMLVSVSGVYSDFAIKVGNTNITVTR